MKFKIPYLIGLLILVFTFNMAAIAEAAHYEKEVKSVTISDKIKNKSVKVKSFFKQIFSKKSKSKSKDKTIRNTAIAALIIGAISLVCLILPVVLVSVGLWIWFVAALFAIIGDVLAIKALMKIKKSKNEEEYRNEKRLAKVGLVLSLLTGLIPLVFLVLVMLGG